MSKGTLSRRSLEPKPDVLFAPFSSFAFSYGQKQQKKNSNHNKKVSFNLPLVEREHTTWGAGLAQCENARLPPMCPGFNSRTQRHMWVEFVVGSLLCS